MKQLSIEIDPDDTNPGRIHVKVPENEAANAHCDLPFTGDVGLPAVLKALEVSSLLPDYFTPQELEWLSQHDLVGKEGDQQFLESAHKRQAIVGGMLYKSLFKTEVLRGAFNRIRELAEHSNELVHLELKFPANAKVVGAIPWELLHDGTRFLCAESNCTLTRYIVFDRVKPRRQAPERLKILLIAPRPAGSPEALIKGDEGALRTAVSRLESEGIIELIALNPPTLPRLQDFLSDIEPEEMPHIIHFDGHGTFGRLCPGCRQVVTSPGETRCSTKKTDGKCNTRLPGSDEAQGHLLFEDEQGNPYYVSATSFAQTLSSATVSGDPDSLPPALSLVVLSACKSAVALQGESVFNGVAQRLIDVRIPAVIAMQFRIDESDAARFFELLYKRIAKDPLAEAVNRGIKALGIDQGQWYRPVLYLRWQDNEGGRLFEPHRAAPPEPKPVAPSTRTDILQPDKGAEHEAAYPGGTNYFLKLTQEFLPVEGRRILAVDQEGVVKSFAMMVVPAWRKNMDGKHIMVLEAGDGRGKSLALDRFEHICRQVKKQQRLICCKIDFEGQPGLFPRAVALKILKGLRDAAEDDPGLTLFLQSRLIDPLESPGSAHGFGRSEQDKQSIGPDKLAEDLYCGLNELSRERTVVLLLDNCQAIAEESGPWLISNFLTRVRDGRNTRIVVVLTNDRSGSLDSKKYGLRGWREVDFPPAIGRILPEDVQHLMRLHYPDVPVPSSDEARDLLTQATALSPGESPSMRSLLMLLYFYAMGARRRASAGGHTNA